MRFIVGTAGAVLLLALWLHGWGRGWRDRSKW